MQKRIRIAKTALIGEKLEIISAKNPSLKGIKGYVCDETRNTITIQDKKEMKKIIKNQAIFRIGEITIDGKRFQGRIEERIKNA